MHRGVVIAVRPKDDVADKKPECTGTVLAHKMILRRIYTKVKEYKFNEGSDKGCTKGNIIEINRKKKDGSIDVDCD